MLIVWNVIDQYGNPVYQALCTVGHYGAMWGTTRTEIWTTGEQIYTDANGQAQLNVETANMFSVVGKLGYTPTRKDGFPDNPVVLTYNGDASTAARAAAAPQITPTGASPSLTISKETLTPQPPTPIGPSGGTPETPYGTDPSVAPESAPTPTPPEVTPTPTAPSKTLVARVPMMPTLALMLLRTIRDTFIKKEVHKKLHPLV